MTDRPIIFSAPMVRALLDGRKTQTRRLVKNVPPMPSADDFVHQPTHAKPYLDSYCGNDRTEKNHRGMSDKWAWWTVDDRPGYLFKVPYVPGDLLWVRECFTPNYFDDGSPAYKADRTKDADDICPRPKFKPAIHMPRWASRITLEVTGVKVERLNEITQQDVFREGLHNTQQNEIESVAGRPLLAAECFAWLWESLHGQGSWAANPFVAAISFNVHKCNIDRMAAK